ncbi:MAG: SDR family oxidoreductase [Corynebacterium provencense]|jgi:NAD(P)-dependent dehydrogenase (short-subunit alcohol dehydrogenase family)|uniref:SDR family oxidoreductase n=1 Tax=Corynebacterium provencense TaxID=1737425 RepID=UPI002989BBCD|nr:SDR family oxidoreductase [Corynebacterium provencense]
MSTDTTPVPRPDSGVPRVAVVTGAGGGLGRAFSTALARAGWTVAALGRSPSTLEATVTACAAATHSDSQGDSQGDSHGDSHGRLHSAVVCDVGDEESVTRAFSEVTDRYGRLDLLVNNAGVPGPTGRIDEVDPSGFTTTMRTNATGTFLCTRAAFAWMASHGGGRIINNGSVAARVPRAHAAAYAASKAAVASLTVSTALDGRDCGVTATELDIGNARTGLLSSFTGAEPVFDAAEAARLLVTVADLPAGVSVDNVTVTAAGMPFLGRG